jgi:hypothetical protein
MRRRYWRPLGPASRVSVRGFIPPLPQLMSALPDAQNSMCRPLMARRVSAIAQRQQPLSGVKRWPSLICPFSIPSHSSNDIVLNLLVVAGRVLA